MVGRDKILIASKYFEKGYELQKKGKIDDAIEEYKSSILYHPTARAYTFLGWAYSLQGKYETAIDKCHQAIELDPGHANSYTDIGVYLIELKRIDEAIIWLEKGIKMAGINSSYYAIYHLGRAYEKKGDWINAIKLYNQSLTSNPDFEAAQDAAIRLSTLLN